MTHVDKWPSVIFGKLSIEKSVENWPAHGILIKKSVLNSTANKHLMMINKKYSLNYSYLFLLRSRIIRLILWIYWTFSIKSPCFVIPIFQIFAEGMKIQNLMYTILFNLIFTSTRLTFLGAGCKYKNYNITYRKFCSYTN